MPPKRKTAAPPARKQRKAATINDEDDDLGVQPNEAASVALAAVPPPPIPSEPLVPIQQSYTYASPIPSECSKIDAAHPSIKVPCVLGVDEAGRGPVLGPLVYGIAYCPLSYQDEMKQIGFADSKALTAERRDTLLSALMDHNQHLGWAVRVMSPQDISAGMLRRRPTNLNAQSSQATVSLIAGVLDSGVDVTEIYVDTVGDPKSYAKLLSSHFPRHPHIKWTVTSKADAIYPIVGAASIAAKVTRDRCIEGWKYAEQSSIQLAHSESEQTKVLADSTNHNAPPTQRDTHGQGNKRKAEDSPPSAQDNDDVWSNMGSLGSGYPGDPNTVAFLKRTIDPVFGWPGIVRFSWATAKTMLDEKVKPPSSTTTQPTTAPPALSGKRLTRSLSRTSSFADSPPSPPTPAAPTETRPCSLYGTLLPQPAIEGGTAPRAYRVKWIDEPVSISKFFGPTSTKPKPKPATPAPSSAESAHPAASPAEFGGGFEVSALQRAVDDWLRNEPQSLAKKAAATNTGTVQLNVGKLVKELGLTPADASFSL